MSDDKDDKIMKDHWEKPIKDALEDMRNDINRQLFTLPTDYKRPWILRRWLNRTGFHIRKPWGWR